uniref:Amidase domain-containing protein n=1 Tax=Arundo donax TaxID=35708 RepID=A0A0A8XRQ2_ARUDO
MYFHKEIFKTADVIVSPMTGVTAYTLQDDALNSGELDYINGAALVRYSIAGNFLGLPAITVMVGHDKGGAAHRAPVHRPPVVRGDSAPHSFCDAGSVREGLQEAGGVLRSPQERVTYLSHLQEIFSSVRFDQV